MADTVTSQVVRSAPGWYVVHLTNASDGTGEAAVTKVDISTLLTSSRGVPTYSAVQRIEYNVNGMVVRLHWDHTTDDTVAQLAGSGLIDVSADGGLVDPKSTGGTGDILLTTSGHSSGDSYDITIWLKLK